jgi:hypothetical protein
MSLDRLTTGELNSADVAAQYLMSLHERHDAFDPQLHTKLSTARADVQAMLEDRAASERRAKVADASRRANKL